MKSRLIVGSSLLAMLLTGVGIQTNADPILSSLLAPNRTAQQRVFKGRIDLVRHDVTVIDNRTGKPVSGLTREDFTISENGQPQKIGAFLAESQSGSDARSDDTSRERRVFLLVFGTGRLEGPVDPYDGAIRFLRALRPTDLVAVMAFNRATRFSADHASLASVVERLKSQAGALRLQLLDDASKSRFQETDLSSDAQAAVDSVFLPIGSEESLQNVTTLLLGSPVPRQNAERWRPWNRLLVQRDLLKVHGGIEYLRGLAGSKHLICLTERGFTLPVTVLGEPKGLRLVSDEDDRRLARRANDADVSLHTIHTAGTSPGTFMSFAASQNVALHTGGQATSIRTASEALARIDDATRGGYLLAYEPSNSVLDGTYRNVSVTVNRRNVTLIYRRGYTARADAEAPNVRDIVTRQRLREAAALGILQSDIGLQASAARVRASDGATQVRVDVVIDGSSLSLRRTGEKHEGTIDLLILCADEEQKVVGHLDQQMALGLDEQRYRQAMTTGVPYTAVVPVVRAATRVKILVYDYEADRLGSLDVRVR